MFFILFLIFTYIYFHSTLIVNFSLILCILGFFGSNLLIGIYPYSLKIHIYRIIFIIMILFIIYDNSTPHNSLTSLLLPFCQNKVDYVHDFKIKSLDIYYEKGSILFLPTLTVEITTLLESLSDSENYWSSICFYPHISGYNNEAGIKMWIDDPIIINKDSNPLLLTKFIMNRLNLMIDLYYLDDSIFNSDQSIIVIKYLKIELQ